MFSIYENLEFILRTTVSSEICPFALGKKKPPHGEAICGSLWMGLRMSV